MANREVVICSPVRTAIGTYGGTLKDVPATDLGAVVVRATLERAKLPPDEVGTVVMGNVIQGGNKMNPARQAAIHGGVPVDIPAMTVNRVCGSGAQAIASAAQEVMLGFIDSAVAGGMENMDRAPYLMSSGRWGYRMGDGQIFDAMLMDGLNDAFSGQHSGWHTEDLARSHQITREEQDRWAERSQKLFSASQSAGTFATEIAAVEITSRKGPTKFDKDEHNRPDTTLESLSKLKPAFRKDGTITAGNAPGLNSGAAAMIVADRAWAEKRGLKPVARLVAYGIGAVEPGMFGLGPVPAVRQALDRAGWEIADVERVEINEALRGDRDRWLPRNSLCLRLVNVKPVPSARTPDRRDRRGAHDAILHSLRRDGIKRGDRHFVHRRRSRHRACPRIRSLITFEATSELNN